MIHKNFKNIDKVVFGRGSFDNMAGILAEKRNYTVSRKDILLKVWNDDSFFNSRNLDVYINKLRNFLKADSSVCILTVKGVGYRFVVA